MLRLKRVDIQQHLEEEQARLEQIEQGRLETRSEREGTPMEMRTCSGCGKEAREPGARFCPYCGAGLPISPAPLLPIKKPAKEVAKSSISFSLVAIVVLIVISTLVAVVLRRHEVTTPSLMSGPLPESQPSDPQLALLSVRCEKHARGGQFVLEGQVQNISDSSLQDIVVVVTVYNANPGCIGSDEAPIEHATLQPGHTSPFRVAVDYDPTVAYYKVKFKHRQGDTLPTRDSRSS
jgi:hypothetical protein